MKLCYVANIRLPTEKAHGLQVVENCEALARAGADVSLVVPRRVNSRKLSDVDVHEHYGVDRTFTIRRAACLDLLPIASRSLLPLASVLQTISFSIVCVFSLLGDRSNAYYSRDVLPLLALSLVKPRRSLTYEAHQTASGAVGRRLQRACVRRVGLVIAVTERLAETLRGCGDTRVVVLRDGFRAGRFDTATNPQPSRRGELNVPDDALLVGYVGRLETMGESKGIDTFVEAAAILRDPRVHFCIVGGPPDSIDAVHSRWLAAGLTPECFHDVGAVTPNEVPGYLSACDVCLLPLPNTPHFANDASPLKLFEYLASGRAIVATALPSLQEVLTHEQTALLVEPGDPQDLARAVARLRDDRPLRDRLSADAKHASASFTWNARAARILAAIGESLKS